MFRSRKNQLRLERQRKAAQNTAGSGSGSPASASSASATPTPAPAQGVASNVVSQEESQGTKRKLLFPTSQSSLGFEPEFSELSKEPTAPSSSGLLPSTPTRGGPVSPAAGATSIPQTPTPTTAIDTSSSTARDSPSHEVAQNSPSYQKMVQPPAVEPRKIVAANKTDPFHRPGQRAGRKSRASGSAASPTTSGSQSSSSATAVPSSSEKPAASLKVLGQATAPKARDTAGSSSTSLGAPTGSLLLPGQVTAQKAPRPIVSATSSVGESGGSLQTGQATALTTLRSIGSAPTSLGAPTGSLLLPGQATAQKAPQRAGSASTSVGEPGGSLQSGQTSVEGDPKSAKSQPSSTQSSSSRYTTAPNPQSGTAPRNTVIPFAMVYPRPENVSLPPSPPKVAAALPSVAPVVPPSAPRDESPLMSAGQPPSLPVTQHPVLQQGSSVSAQLPGVFPVIQPPGPGSVGRIDRHRRSWQADRPRPIQGLRKPSSARRTRPPPPTQALQVDEAALLAVGPQQPVRETDPGQTGVGAIQVPRMGLTEGSETGLHPEVQAMVNVQSTSDANLPMPPHGPCSATSSEVWDVVMSSPHTQACFVALAGLAFQEKDDFQPERVLGRQYRRQMYTRDWKWIEDLRQGRLEGPKWEPKTGDPIFEEMRTFFQGNLAMFGEILRMWATRADAGAEPSLVLGFPTKENEFTWMLRKAGWIPESEWYDSPEVQHIRAIKEQDLGPKRTADINYQRKNYPLLWKRCEGDLLCGFPSYVKLQNQVYAKHFKRTLREYEEDCEKNYRERERAAHRLKTWHPTGGPPASMQIRGVPEEERAIGPDGKRLPFAIVTSEDRRKYVEETGPFGKPRRRGLSRSKTATPAKKEDPNLDAFAEALAFDSRKRLLEDEEKRQSAAQTHSASHSNLLTQSSSTSLALKDTHTTSAGPSTLVRHKEPTEVLLYGFKPSLQYAALDKYERIGGRICEDYARDPPTTHRKYHTISSYPVAKPLTYEEKKKVNKFAGGESWVKITFESAEGAHRAVTQSPQTINGHWVFAELYHGLPPKEDKAIPVTFEDSDPPGLRRPKPYAQGARPLSTSVSTPALPTANNTSTLSNLPGSFTSISTPHAPEPPSSISSSTASSATATATTAATGNSIFADAQNARSRSFQSSAPGPEPAGDPSEFCTRIPTVRRAVLRPAEEALLPSRTTAQWIASYLPLGVLDGQIIGNEIPRTEDGQFDYKGASLYWKLWYWIDRLFHVDTLGLHDD
ncbi:MAG: hypothetical protein M1837_002055 [Sclerophora amabilis]|nr:MAG: hypothetical protein M1837_002055 [Sclerophora amabilis]